MDRFDAMRVFIAVADRGSLTAGARQLGRPLTSISRILSALEDQVGTALLSRTTRRMSLTEPGQRYLDLSRRILNELDETESLIAGRTGVLSGAISITAPVAFGRFHVMPMVQAFLAQHPGLNARVILDDNVVDLTFAAVDLAFRIGALKPSALIAKRIGTVSTITCAASSYLKDRGTPKTPSDLTAHRCIVFSAHGDQSRWLYTSDAHGRISVRIEPRLFVNSAEAAVEAAVSGLGVTRVLSYQAEPQLASRQLTRVLTHFEPAKIPVHIVHKHAKAERAQVRALIDFAVKTLQPKFKPSG